MKRNTFIFGLAFAAIAATAPAQVIKLRGSDTLGAKCVPQLAEAFKAAGNKVKFDIAAEGSTTAFPALANGTADIGMSSRKAKEEEITMNKTKGVFLKQVPVLHDMIAVVVNQNNPVQALTAKQVAKIFTGGAKDWSEMGGQGGAISIYTRNTSSGTYKDWQKLGMGGKDYAASAQKMAGNEQIVAEVAKNPAGIGYVGLAYIKAKGVKVVPIDGKTPDIANLASYPYARECYYYVGSKMTPEAQAFVDFTLSPKGADVIRKTGFIPMMDVR